MILLILVVFDSILVGFDSIFNIFLLFQLIIVLVVLDNVGLSLTMKSVKFYLGSVSGCKLT